MTRRQLRLAGGCAAAALLAVPAAAAPAPAPPPSIETTQEQPLRESIAWTLLAEGRHFQALRHFARQAGAHPDDGTPKVGYALGAAAAGDLSGGADAMRRALRTDPDALARQEMNPELRALVRKAAGLYLWRLERDAADRDSALMLAALYYLLRDEESARYAVDLAAARAPAERNLHDLIDRWMNPAPPAAEPQPDPEPEPEPEPAPQPEPEPEPAPADPAASPVPDPPDAPAPVEEPQADPTPQAPEPKPKPRPRPLKPVDYDKLHEGLLSVGRALDSFTKKLIERTRPPAETPDG